MKKFLLSLLVVALLAMTVAGVVSAQTGPVDVFPFEDGATYNVADGDSIHIWWGWLATTRGLVRTYLNAWTASYQLTNVDTGQVWLSLDPAQAHARWSPIMRLTPADVGLVCASPFHYVSDWEGGEFQLPAGTYELVTVWSQSRPVNDGWHTCADAVTGEPMASPPSLWRPESGTWTVTIEVE